MKITYIFESAYHRDEEIYFSQQEFLNKHPEYFGIFSIPGEKITVTKEFSLYPTTKVVTEVDYIH